MDISGLSSTSAMPANALPQGPGELDKNAFLKLLVQQMKNQDPLEPQANGEFIAQLANFSSLEQMQTLNENVVTLALLQQSNALMEQLTQSSALIGQTVVYGDTAQTGTVNSVKIQDGLAVLNIGGTDVPLADVTEVLGSDPTSTGASS